MTEGQLQDPYGTGEPWRCGFGIFATGPKDPFFRVCNAHDMRHDQHSARDEYNEVGPGEDPAYTVDRALGEFKDGVDKTVHAHEFSAGHTLPFLRLRGWLYKKLASLGSSSLW